MRVNQLDYNQNLWTVEALHFLYVDFHGAPYERSKNREGGRVSFMPDVLFDPALKQYVYDCIGKTEFEYKESLCITRDLRSSPVAAPVELSDEEYTKVKKQSRFMNRFAPKTIHESNIGTNAYLSKLLFDRTDGGLRRLGVLADESRPTIVMADVNIFERALKVISPLTN